MGNYLFKLKNQSLTERCKVNNQRIYFSIFKIDLWRCNKIDHFILGAR